VGRAAGRHAGWAWRRAPGAAAGFTLLEVLVALTIIAVALAAALRGAMALTGNSRDVDLRLYAVMLAENQLLEMRFARTQATTGETRFDCEQGGVVFSCRQVVTATPNPFFRRVEIHVAENAQGAHEFANLMALLPISN
jgi:general secretion pathway protein I